jgi:hypothetical protein
MAPPTADGKPTSYDGAVRKIADALNRGDGASDQLAGSKPAAPKDLEPGEWPSVKDQIDKFNANDNPPADTRPLNRPTNPLRSDPAPAADHPIPDPYKVDGFPNAGKGPSDRADDFETALHAAQDKKIAGAKKHREEIQHDKHPETPKPGSPQDGSFESLSEKLASIRQKEDKIENELLREQGGKVWRK